MPGIPKLRFTGIAQGGKVVWDNQIEWIRRVSSLEGKRIECSLGPEKRKRTLSQNAYLHFLFALFGELAGYEPEEMKEALKWEHLRIYEDKQLPTVRSTASLDTKEMADFIEKIHRTAAKMGYYLPDPGEAADWGFRG